MLQTQDIEKTVEWYRALLGFTPSMEAGAGWCRLSRNQATVMFMQNKHLGPPHAAATQYVYIDHVLAL